MKKLIKRWLRNLVFREKFISVLSLIELSLDKKERAKGRVLLCNEKA